MHFALRLLTSSLLVVLGSVGDGMAAHEDKDAVNERFVVSITRTIRIARSPKIVFAFLAAEDVLPKVLTGYGPLPAVTGTSHLTGPWSEVGSARLVHLADGTSLREAVTVYLPPNRFSYRVWDFGNQTLAALAEHGSGDFRFEADGDGTTVVWTYKFKARNAGAYLPLKAMVGFLWRGYMDRCLENAARYLAGERL
jgi:polyketide cyclase/dehydrase/lipid transport protein